MALHVFGAAHGLGTVPDEEGDDVAGGRALHFLFAQGAVKVPGKLVQSLASFSHFGQKLEYIPAPLGDDGRHGCGEDEGTHVVHQVVAYHPSADYKSSGGGGGFSQGAHQEVYLVDASLFFATAQPAWPAQAESMGFVHIEQDVGIEVLQADQFLEGSFIAVHAEHALGDNEDVSVVGSILCEDAFQMFDIIVLETDPTGTAQAHTVDEAGMHQLVGQDEVFLHGDGREYARIGIEAAIEDQGRLCVVEACQGRFQLVEGRVVSRQEAGRGG